MTSTSEENGKKRGRRSNTDISGREALLKAAVISFAKRGFEGASLRMIAREAEVDVALCARLFGNKQKLWQAVIDYMAENFEIKHRASVEAMVKQSETDPEGAMKAYIRFYTELCVEHPAFPAFMLQEATVSKSRITIIKDRLVAPIMRPSIKLFENAQRAGVVHCADPVLFARMLASSISHLVSAPDLLPERVLAAGNLHERIIENAIAIFVRTADNND